LELNAVSSPSRRFAPFLIADLPDHIPAGKVKIDPLRNILPNDLGSGRSMEGAFVDAKESLAVTGLRTEPQQRSKRQPVNHAQAAMVDGLKHQSIDVVAPVHQVACRYNDVSLIIPIQPLTPIKTKCQRS
jgi:hypothetical protein